MKQRILISASLAVLLWAGMAPAQAQIFGPSDEEKAHEASQDDQLRQSSSDISQLQGQLRDLSQRVQSLTDGLTRATGANEELSHQLELLRAKMDRQQKDFAYRLCTVSAQQLGADTGDQGLNCAAGGSGTPSSGAPPAPQNFAPGASLQPLGSGGDGRLGADDPGTMRGRPPGTLGTLSAGGAASGPPARFATAPAAPGGGAQFDMAMNLLGRAQYAEAAAAFRGYADSHPDDDDLSPKALYWVGQIAYLQQDYPTATRVFAEQIKKYPKSSRGPDSMLKLGQALIASGQTSGGCTTLGAIKKQYPSAAPSTLAAAATARKAACR